jgi:nickel superoxide dismutase
MKYLSSILLIVFGMSLTSSATMAASDYDYMYSDSSNITKILMALAELDEDHCEVPCGIYGDSLRIALISEHIRTVEKASKQIEEISAASPVNYNQLVRWVTNKEKHAEEIQDIVSQYFLHQRIKLTDATDKEKYTKYLHQLESLHKISVYAMKSKQGTDQDNIDNLKAAVEDFEGLYFHKH